MKWPQVLRRSGLAAIVLSAGLGAALIAAPTAELHNGATAFAPATRLNPPRSFVVTAGGDILAESAVRAAGQSAAAGSSARFDFAPTFAPLTAVNADADMAICHMELPIGLPGQHAGNAGRSPYGGNRLIAPYELAAGARAGGFTRCSTASNHSYDTGFSGVVSTLEALDQAGLRHTGTARSAAEANPTVTVVNGVRVGHVSFTRYTNTVRPTQSWQQNYASSVSSVVADVDALRAAGAQIVIVSLHLSREMQRAPTSIDRGFATVLINSADIDAIIHHGPHVVQPLEWVNGVPVFWSLGNLVSGMGLPSAGRYADQRTLDGLIARIEFFERSDGGWTAQASAVAVCTDPVTRVVRPARTALTAPGTALSNRERTELARCLARTEAVVGPVG